MASTIRIKRATNTAVPTSLENAELAFSENSDKLFIGKGAGGSGGSATTIEEIGGKGAFCALTGAQTVGGNKTFSNNVVITGDLTVNGTTTTLNTTNSVVKDSLIELGNGTTGTPSNDAGLVIERGDSDNAFIGWDEGASKFRIGTKSGITGATTDVTSGGVDPTTATLIGNLQGNVTGNVTGNTSGSAGSCTGNAATATSAATLTTARTIGGVSFNGSANIDLPGVNSAGSQDTSGNAATATALATGRTVGMTGDVVWTSASFDGTGNVTGTATIQAGAVDIAMLNTSQTPSGSNFLRGDGAWTAISGTDTTYSISCVDGDNSDEEKIRLTAGGDGSGNDDIVLEAGSGLSVARDGDKITFTNTRELLQVDSDLSSVSSSDDTLASAKAIKTYVDANDLSLIDEDDFSTNSASRPPSQQSVKAYVAAVASPAIHNLTQEFRNKTINKSYNTISNLDTTNFASGILDTDLSSVSASDDTLASAKAIKAYVDAGGLSLIDEDDFSTNSDSRPPSQQSTKAYIASYTTAALNNLPTFVTTLANASNSSYVSTLAIKNYVDSNSGNASTVTVADESSDTTCFPLFATAATGDLAPKSDSQLTYNSSTGELGCGIIDGGTW